jgi:hypothetical protein
MMTRPKRPFQVTTTAHKNAAWINVTVCVVFVDNAAACTLPVKLDSDASQSLSTTMQYSQHNYQSTQHKQDSTAWAINDWHNLPPAKQHNRCQYQTQQLQHSNMPAMHNSCLKARQTKLAQTVRGLPY